MIQDRFMQHSISRNNFSIKIYIKIFEKRNSNFFCRGRNVKEILFDSGMEIPNYKSISNKFLDRRRNNKNRMDVTLKF